MSGSVPTLVEDRRLEKNCCYVNNKDFGRLGCPTKISGSVRTLVENTRFEENFCCGVSK